MSHIYKYTVDSFGYIPHLWEIYRDPVRGLLRCISLERSGNGRAHITAELLPPHYKEGV